MTLLVANLVAAHAQDRFFRKGQRLEKELRLKSAVEAYAKSYEKTGNVDALKRAAFLATKTNDGQTSLDLFSKLYLTRAKDPDIEYGYGLALLRSQKYDEAKRLFKQYLRYKPESRIARNKLRSADFAKKAIANPTRFEVVPLSVNSAENDFSPVITPDGLVFTSSRKKAGISRPFYSWDQQGTTWIFKAATDSILSNEVKVFDKGLNFEGNNGPITFNSDFNLAITAHNHPDAANLSWNKDIPVDYMALFEHKRLKNGKWSEGDLIFFSKKEYNCMHPALYPDGSKMIFASDMPGGLGGMDLYLSQRIGQTWSEPMNLGPGINTEGNEVFPFLQGDSILYFSSDGLVGLGDLDVFNSRIKGELFTTPTNMGFPINSSFDDFGFWIAAGSETGYVSSNRPGGVGGDDVYRFRELNCNIKGLILDSLTFEPIARAKVKLDDNNGGEVFNLITNDLGEFEVKLNPVSNYDMVVNATGYSTRRTVYGCRMKNLESGRSANSRYNIMTEMVKGRSIIMKGLVRDAETKLIIEAASVLTQDVVNQNQDNFITDANGRFEFTADNLNKVVFTASKEGYLTNTQMINFGSSTFRADSVIVIDLERLRFDKRINIEPIYYDLDKWEIRPDAAAKLDRLIKVMNDNPTIRVEMGSHTDSRATGPYNEKLSEQRATAAIDYLVARGIERFRLTYKYYGESQLIEPCPDGVPCTEEQHQRNRRTEFKVVEN